MEKINLYKLYLLFSGIIAGLTLTYTILWPLSILSFSFFIFLLNKELSSKKGFFLGLLFGLPFTGGSIIWIFSSFPLTSLGINSYILSAFLILIIFTIFSSVLSLSTAIFGYIFVKFNQNSLYNIIFIPSLWVLSEILRSFLFFILTIAPQSLFGPHWTFGYSGYILAGNPILLQFASFGGVYFLSFIFALLGVIIVYFYKSKKILIALVILTSLLYIPINIDTIFNKNSLKETLGIAAIKTTEPSYFTNIKKIREARLERISSLIKIITSQNKNLDLIIIPEDARFIKLFTEKKLNELPIGNDTFLLGSARFSEKSQPAKASILTYSKNTGIDRQYTKLLLVPEGEYMSNLNKIIFYIFGMNKRVEKFKSYKEYTKGTKITPTYIKNTALATTLCSEIYSPLIQRNLAVNSGIIINLASHSSLKGSKALFNQIISISKVRAVENNRYLIEATNFANSFVISNNGIIVAITRNEYPFDFLQYEAPLYYDRTIFSLYPYLFPISFLIIVILPYFVYLYRKIELRKLTK